MTIPTIDRSLKKGRYLDWSTVPTLSRERDLSTKDFSSEGVPLEHYGRNDDSSSFIILKIPWHLYCFLYNKLTLPLTGSNTSVVISTEVQRNGGILEANYRNQI